jgi:hypothetical protein
MQRRQFLSASLAASAAALTTSAAQAQTVGQREYYDLRKYTLQNGPQQKLTASYFADALIPALNRLGVTPVGAFTLDVGPETPTLYLLLPSKKLETLVTAELLLQKDEVFMKAAAPFWSAPAAQPPFKRVESTLLIAFEGHPVLTPPAKEKRIFQLRTYESPTDGSHVRKVRMFHSGEFEIFAKAGCGQVFYGDALVGQNLPQLTYMLTFPDLPTLQECWKKFSSNPDWKKLSADPLYASEPIVSNISNLYLNPTSYSQI